MATWKEINDALSGYEGEHAAERLHVTIEGAMVECKCGVRFSCSDRYEACQAWFEHRAIRGIFPNAQSGR